MGKHFKFASSICPLFRPRNTFNFPKLSKAEYESIRIQCETFCETIVKEIIAAKTLDDFEYLRPKEFLNKFDVVSKYGDWLGPVIKKDNKYYRCIEKKSVERFNTLWKSGILQVFSKRGYLPKLSISEYYSDEYPIIIEQETLEIIDIRKLSLDHSKKGLLFVSLLQFISKKMGFALIDPHLFNYTFSNNRFIYFDLGSFSTIEEYSKHRDFSMVVLGAYRILFSYFPDSVLSKQELDIFRHDADKSYREDYLEFLFYRKSTLRYCRKHCSKIIYQAFRNIFSNHECTPWDVITCFLSERKDEVDILLEEIM